MDTFTIQGRTITMPVEVRRSSTWLATYLVDAAAAQRLVAPTGLEVAEARPGRGMVNLAYVSYADSDLGTYNEFAVTVLVRLHDAGPATARRRSAEVRRGRCGVYIHQLPVDQSFTLEAGRTIWGYPKTVASFDVSHRGRTTTCTMHQDGEHVLTLSVRKGLFPMPRQKPYPTYTFLDGVLRMTRWESDASGARGRLFGASLELGEGPIAGELRSLGLPKRPLLSINVPLMRSRFGPAEVVAPAARPAAQT